MKKRSLTFLLAGALLATMIPSVTAAGWRGGPKSLPDGWVPGCHDGWTPQRYELGPVPDVLNVNFRRANRNGDAWVCSRMIASRRNPERRAFLWVDNRNWRDEDAWLPA